MSGFSGDELLMGADDLTKEKRRSNLCLISKMGEFQAQLDTALDDLELKVVGRKCGRGLPLPAGLAERHALRAFAPCHSQPNYLSARNCPPVKTF